MQLIRNEPLSIFPIVIARASMFIRATFSILVFMHVFDFNIVAHFTFFYEDSQRNVSPFFPILQPITAPSPPTLLLAT